MNRIRTRAYLPFPAAAVWAVLTDFDRYAEWNPLNIRASGEARLGARIAMTFINPARPGATIDQVVTIVEFNPERRLSWLGHVPLLFKGVHFFALQPEGGGTRLDHGEDQSGLVPLTFGKTLVRERFVPAYEACNAALAARLAALAAPG